MYIFGDSKITLGARMRLSNTDISFVFLDILTKSDFAIRIAIGCGNWLNDLYSNECALRVYCNRLCSIGQNNSELKVQKTNFENQKRPSPEGESRYFLS